MQYYDMTSKKKIRFFYPLVLLRKKKQLNECKCRLHQINIPVSHHLSQFVLYIRTCSHDVH